MAVRLQGSPSAGLRGCQLTFTNSLVTALVNRVVDGATVERQGLDIVPPGLNSALYWQGCSAGREVRAGNLALCRSILSVTVFT